MTKSYEKSLRFIKIKGVYHQYFSEDPKGADPFYYMLEQLFFLSEQEPTMENVTNFMNTLPNFYNKKRITTMLHCFLTKAKEYPWEDGHDVYGNTCTN